MKGKNKLDFIKMKNFCSATDTVQRMKQQATDCEKILAKHVSDNGLVSKIHKELSKLSNKKQATQFKNGQMT